MDNKGKVWFIGAGSGAADLITVRGQRLLQEADMIVYAGSLVNPALLENAKPGCEIYDSARLHLDQVMELMIPAAHAGKHVVRLHTGDPSIYGAVREQMDRLDAAGIEYEVCPGVSSFCGAAAALKKEYTLPGVSQTLILTRMEGRTPVPDGERIRTLAAHGASMAIFLSASMLEKLQAELLVGGEDARRAGMKGYDESTPCAVVYKATWPDERVIETTLGVLARSAADAGITKTALILVGGFLGEEYELSKLYDAGFSTEFRKAENVDSLEADMAESEECGDFDGGDDMDAPAGRRVLNAAVICYTKKGSAAAERISDALSGAAELAVNSIIYKFSRSNEENIEVFDNENSDVNYRKNASSNYDAKYFSDTKMLMRKIFSAGDEGGIQNGAARTDIIIFVSAAGIAVRAAAPHAVSKTVDPAVIVVNDNCDYVIPLLSGHIGGANMIAESLAAELDAEAVITTASDGAGVRAVDMFAQEKGFALEDMQAAKLATAALLRRSDVRNEDEDCFKIWNIDGRNVLVINDISVKLRPLKYCIGIGCKKNTDPLKMAEFVNDVIDGVGIAANEIYRVASIDIKAGEPAVKLVAELLGAPFFVYSAEQLARVDGEFSASEFVQSVVGVDSVCERSAAAACGGAYRLIVRKQVRDGMTIAVAERTCV